MMWTEAVPELGPSCSVAAGRATCRLVYWSQTRNTRTFVPERCPFIVMSREKEAAELDGPSSLNETLGQSLKLLVRAR